MNKSFLRFYQLEWRRWNQVLLRELALLCVIPVLILLLYLIYPPILLNMAFTFLSLPSEVYAFLGIPPGTYGEHFSFFIFYAVLLLHIWFAYKKCTQAVKALRWDDRNGSIYLWINQLVSRRQFILLKYVGTLISFWAVYFCFHLVLFMTILIGANQYQFKISAGVIVKLFFLGGFVITMLITIASFYAMIKESDDGGSDTSCAKYLIFATLLSGNIYKVRDLLIWVAELFHERTTIKLDSQGFADAFSWLDGLYWLSPLSWLNPYALDSGRALSVQYFLCIFLTAVFGFFVIFIYQKRKL